MTDELEQKFLCSGCVGESYLQSVIASLGKVRPCSYCGKRRESFELGEVCDMVDGAFQRHYSRARMDMDGFEWAMAKDPDLDFSFEPAGEPVVFAIAEAAMVEEDVAQDIQSVLEDRYSDYESAKLGETTEYADDLNYEFAKVDDRDWHDTWRSFERSLKTEARFFSVHAMESMQRVFAGIDSMKTRTGNSLIVEAGPGTSTTSLFRARVFQSDDRLEAALTRPDRELGPPPSRMAASGRMNARGIAVFYGATDPQVAIAEVRPPVGSQVLIGRFEIVRTIRLLDLSALGSVTIEGSIFDPSFADQLGRISFLQTLSHRMARPVMPDDQEFEYLPTQAIADFLATETVAQLDGIMFPSVQTSGETRNVVLFHKASLVEQWQVPKETKISVDTFNRDEDGWHREYTVSWEDGEEEPERERSNQDLWDDWKLTPTEADDQDFGWGRLETLKITPSDLEVRIIEAVRFETEDHAVKHVRFDARPPEF